MTTLNVAFVTETCCYETCNITFAMTREFYDRVRDDHSWWYCPLGHRQHYTGTTDAEKLRRAEARETALKDQLRAAVRDAEATRVQLLRDRQRFANGVCPCCNRSFENVRRHMATQHPEYPRTDLTVPHNASFECSCGYEFDTFRGLRIHQGKSRRDGWDSPDARSWNAHLTVVGAR